MATDSKKILFTSSEGTEFMVEREIADKFLVIKNMLEDVGENDQAVPLPNVSGPILDKVIQYCQHHRDDPSFQTAYDNADTEIGEWDLEFCKVDQSTLYELILASNYLDVKPLLDLTCKTVANMLRDKSPEEIRQTFGIVNDFNEEEMIQVKNENGLGGGKLRLKIWNILKRSSDKTDRRTNIAPASQGDIVPLYTHLLFSFGHFCCI